MKKLIIILLFFSVFISLDVVYAQSNVDFNYPLKVGNVFSYLKIRHRDFPYLHEITYAKCVILSDTIINNKEYFVFDIYPFIYDRPLLRIDTSDGRLLSYDSGLVCDNYIYENLVDSLRANLGDPVIYCSHYHNTCVDINPINIFGITKPSRKFEWHYPSRKFEWHYYSASAYVISTYAQEFGLYFKKEGGTGSLGSAYTEYTMKGCVINGVLYGDTTTYVGIENKSIHASFSLSQNYPNPFNPVTKIKYDIPPSKGARGMIVQLIIYDILGREIETLVSETQKPGSYVVTWDGSRYASGVYFYRLITDEYVETKKMVLIK